MGYINIHDIQFSNVSKVENGVLFVDQDAVKKLVLEDENIKSVTLDIAHPGESVRITPVKDVIEPRVKVEGPGGIFPGVIAKVDTVGSGKTYALKGMAVVTAGKIVGFQEGIIDISPSKSKPQSRIDERRARFFRLCEMRPRLLFTQSQFFYSETSQSSHDRKFLTCGGWRSHTIAISLRASGLVFYTVPSVQELR